MSREDVIQNIIEQIKAGNPVIYRGTKIETASEESTGIEEGFDEGSRAVGHFMIAYDLESHIDEATNEEIINDITMHMCNTSEN